MESKSRLRRLKKNSDFLELKNKGLRIRAADWLQIQYLRSKEGTLSIGVTTGRKVASAVIRNRLKRWCLEYFRKRKDQTDLISGQMNFLFRPHKKENFYKELDHEFFDSIVEKALKALGKRT